MALHGRMVSKKKVLLMRYSSVILLIQIIQYGQENMVLYLSSSMSIGAELGGAAGAPAPPLLYNPRNFIV